MEETRSCRRCGGRGFLCFLTALGKRGVPLFLYLLFVRVSTFGSFLSTVSLQQARATERASFKFSPPSVLGLSWHSLYCSPKLEESLFLSHGVERFQDTPFASCGCYMVLCSIYLFFVGVNWEYTLGSTPSRYNSITIHRQKACRFKANALDTVT